MTNKNQDNQTGSYELRGIYDGWKKSEFFTYNDSEKNSL